MRLLLVCAYDSERIPDWLNTALMTCHEFIMTEDRVVPSNLYKVRIRVILVKIKLLKKRSFMQLLFCCLLIKVILISIFHLK